MSYYYYNVAQSNGNDLRHRSRPKQLTTQLHSSFYDSLYASFSFNKGTILNSKFERKEHTFLLVRSMAKNMCDLSRSRIREIRQIIQ